MSFELTIANKILPVKELLHWVNIWRLKNRKVVFTNGCFDIIHRGHIDYLIKAADLGHELIIGLNSDASVKLLNKGSNRPIQDQESRAMILSSFSFVSAVCIFDEETPQNLIREIQPDILVKGGDYRPEQIAGSKEVIANGGKVEIIPFLEGYSTSKIVEKIKLD